MYTTSKAISHAQSINPAIRCPSIKLTIALAPLSSIPKIINKSSTEENISFHFLLIFPFVVLKRFTSAYRLLIVIVSVSFIFVFITNSVIKNFDEIVSSKNLYPNHKVYSFFTGYKKHKHILEKT